MIAPTKFWEFSDALFEASPTYYDEPLYNETRPQTYERLAELAHKSVGIDKAKFLELVSVAPSDTPRNKGNAIAADLKYFIKVARQNGIHVSPTVVVNGVIDPSIESSSPLEFWLEKAKALNF